MNLRQGITLVDSSYLERQQSRPQDVHWLYVLPAGEKYNLIICEYM